MLRIFTGLLLSTTLGLLLQSCSSDHTDHTTLPDKVDFNLHIKPILSDRCFACHGPDKNARKAELSLHTEEGLFGKLDSAEHQFVVMPGQPGKSVLYQRMISADPETMMPPPESNLSLNDYEIRLVRKWINQGAEWKDHWAFIPPVRPDQPTVRQKDWPQHPIDHFTLSKMEAQKLKPEPEASRESLIRRVSFDLTGLPPTTGEIDAFLNDDSSDAYEKVVDHLLASPAFGERMTSDWLDVARYADSHGYQDDRPRTMWPWRDWVIRAFNQNLPYDQFVKWQIAGDLLDDSGYEQKLATGFNRNHAITQEGGVINEEYLTEYAANRAQTFGTAFLGLTMQCARCHDHKYDPISQEEFYQLFSFFNNVKQERGQISYFDMAPVPSMEVQDPLLDSNIQAIQVMIEQLEAQADQVKEEKKREFQPGIIDAHQIKERLNTGLLAWYQLNETTGWIFDNSVPDQQQGRVNINLPPEIEKPTRVKGYSGNAMQFDGANFLSLGETGDFDHYDPFSFGGWVRHNGSHEKMAGIFSRRNGELHRQGYDLVLTAQNRLRARLISTDQHHIEVESRSKVSPNSWHHIFLTYEGNGRANGLHLFLDGQEQPLRIIQDSLAGKSILNGNDFLVGNWNHRARNLKDLYGFKGGTVDEVRLYDRRLSSLEVRMLAKGDLSSSSMEVADLFEYDQLHQDADQIALQEQLRFYRGQHQEIPLVMVMEEMDTVKDTWVLDRGVYDAKVKLVGRRTPEAILPFSDNLPANRLGLSEWLFDERNPLTARVYVNRLWQMCFGTGIVPTAEDFGSQGTLPSHPELLDWLAVEFRESGWDVKGLLRQILLSATYRQSAVINPRKYQLDPENRWLSRGPSGRLTAEMLRDQALKASGLLSDQVGGRWVKPYQPAGIWKELANQIGENKYRPGRGMELYRRSLYTYWKRTIPPPSMLTLDASERAECTVRRQQTSTPLQSLIILNDPQFVEASRVLAESLITEGTEKEWVEKGFRTILSRSPEPVEEDLLFDLYQEEHQRFLNDPEEALQLLNIGTRPFSKEIEKEKIASLTVVINAIFNMDEAKFK